MGRGRRAKTKKLVENFETSHNAKQNFYSSSLCNYEQKTVFFALTFKKKSPIFGINFFCNNLTVVNSIKISIKGVFVRL